MYTAEGPRRTGRAPPHYGRSRKLFLSISAVRKNVLIVRSLPPKHTHTHTRGYYTGPLVPIKIVSPFCKRHPPSTIFVRRLTNGFWAKTRRDIIFGIPSSVINVTAVTGIPIYRYTGGGHKEEGQADDSDVTRTEDNGKTLIVCFRASSSYSGNVLFVRIVFRPCRPPFPRTRFPPVRPPPPPLPCRCTVLLYFQNVFSRIAFDYKRPGAR